MKYEVLRICSFVVSSEMNQICFKIRDEYGNYVNFQVRSCTSMQRIIDSYKAKRGIVTDVTLTIDSTEITIFDSPRTLAMNDFDVIFAAKSTIQSFDIKVTLQKRTGFMRVYNHTSIATLIDAFVDKYDIDPSKQIILCYKTHICKGYETIGNLGIKTGDTLHDISETYNLL